MFQKYPMCLYQGGNVEASYALVMSEEEESAKRGDGFCGAGESQEKAPDKPAEPAKRNPGRPRKDA